MRLEAIDAQLIRKAVQSFLEQAWGDLAESHWPRKLPIDVEDRDEVIKSFVDERKRGCMRKYSLRLGNRRYPFMKMVFQELLFRDSFFFYVDTHDELDISETTPDFQEWLAIRNYNAEIKKAVEKRWHEECIPILEDVLEEVERQEVPPEEICPDSSPPLVHVVDDERAIAEGVRTILTRRNYRVEVSQSAEDALEKIKKLPPDLIISDLEMGSGMTGLEFCEALRADPALKDISFILATAAGVDLSRLNLIDAFLVKPYEIEVLVTFVRKQLENRAKRTEGGKT